MPNVDVKIWLPVMKALIKKYGNFKVDNDLYNLIVYNLCEICDAIETKRKGNEVENLSAKPKL